MQDKRKRFALGSAVTVAVLAAGGWAHAAVVAQWDYTGSTVGTNNITSITSTGSAAITLNGGTAAGGVAAAAPSGVATGNGSATFNAAQFNIATPDYMVGSSAASALNFTPSSSFTVEAWVNLHSLDAANSRTVFSTRGSGAVGNAGFTLSVDQNGKAVFLVDDGPHSTSSTSGTAVTLDLWTHLAATYDGTSHVVTVYIGNTQTGNTPGLDVTGTLTTSDKAPAISWAQNSTAALTGWDGMIGLVRVSDTVVAPANFVTIPEPTGISLMIAGTALATLKRRSRFAK